MLQFLSYVQYSISGQRIEQLRKFFWCYLPFASNESSQGCPIIVAGGGGGGEIPGPWPLIVTALRRTYLYRMTDNHMVVELLWAQSTCSRAPWVIKFVYLCIQEILVVIKSSICPSICPPYIHTYITLFNFGFKRFFWIFLLADVKCHYYELGVQGIYTILILDIHVMITIINNCQNRVSADQCHMTVSWGQVITSLSWRVYLNCPLTNY